jgi:hypothetical protein
MVVHQIGDHPSLSRLIKGKHPYARQQSFQALIFEHGNFGGNGSRDRDQETSSVVFDS